MMIKKIFLTTLFLSISLFIVSCNGGVEFSSFADLEVYLYSNPNLLEDVTCISSVDGDISSQIVITNSNVDTSVPGKYEITMYCEDSKQNSQTVSRNIIVLADIDDEMLANYTNGLDLSDILPEEKNAILAAMENYLLRNVFAGVPLFQQANAFVYSDRLDLISDDFSIFFGYGEDFSQLTKDDSQVLLTPNTYGKANNYTYRDFLLGQIDTFNQYKTEDGASQAVLSLINGKLYDFYYKEDFSGFQINPQLASGEPIEINGNLVNGEIESSIWQIPIKDDLTWTFNDETNTTSFPSGYEVLDANDFIWSWQKALEKGYFRAVSGGNDFISRGVKNADKYADHDVAFSEVGLKAIDDHMIQMEFEQPLTANDLKYFLTSYNLAPMQQNLYENYLEFYGTLPINTPSSGAYYLESNDNNLVVTLAKNDQFVDSNLYHHTGYQFTYYSSLEAAVYAFNDGLLEALPINNVYFETFENYPNMKVYGNSTIWKMMINGFGTSEIRDEYIDKYPDSMISNSYELEPILQYLEMRQAFYYSIDRQALLSEVSGFYLPEASYFGSYIYADAFFGKSIRESDAGQITFDKYIGDTFAYDPLLAKSYFIDAVSQGIDDGYYQLGTAENYEVITLDFVFSSSGNQNVISIVNKLKEQYESTLIDDEHYVKIEITLNDTDFGNIYYFYLLGGNFDIGLGGYSAFWSLNDFLDSFMEYSKQGFSMNFGIDTHSPEIFVESLFGEEVNLYFSFDALVSALDHRSIIIEGQIPNAAENAEMLITEQLVTANIYVEDIIRDDSFAEAIYDDLNSLAFIKGYEEAFGYVVYTDEFDYLAILGYKDGKYAIISLHGMFDTLENAIKNDGIASYYFVSVNETPLTDQELLTNPYMVTNYSYQSVQEIFTEHHLNADNINFYEVQWTSWVDIYIVAYVNGMYLPIIWL